MFENALTPCLSYLPTLTPEDESIQLLSNVYPALLALARSRYPGDFVPAERRHVLDKVMRVGIIMGYAHANEHVKVTAFLMEQMAVLVEHMGISSCKHLKVNMVSLVLRS